jgi:hypothetical protein
MKTLVILLLSGGINTQQLMFDGDLRRFDGMGVTTSAQATKAMERAQDELFATLFVLDEATNQNIHRPEADIMWHRGVRANFIIYVKE